MKREVYIFILFVMIVAGGVVLRWKVANYRPQPPYLIEPVIDKPDEVTTTALFLNARSKDSDISVYVGVKHPEEKRQEMIELTDSRTLIYREGEDMREQVWDGWTVPAARRCVLEVFAVSMWMPSTGSDRSVRCSKEVGNPNPKLKGKTQ